MAIPLAKGGKKVAENSGYKRRAGIKEWPLVSSVGRINRHGLMINGGPNFEMQKRWNFRKVHYFVA